MFIFLIQDSISSIKDTLLSKTDSVSEAVQDSTFLTPIIKTAESAIKDFNSNPWVAFTLILAALAGLYYAIFPRNNQRKGLAFKRRTFMLVSQKIQNEKIEVYYANNGNKINVENLAITKFAIWNSGNTPIKNDEISKVNSLRVYASGEHKILDHEIMLVTDKSSATEIIPNLVINGPQTEGFLSIQFQYLEPKEGLVIQIYSTATEGTQINLEGAIMGIKGFKEVDKLFKSDTKSQKTLKVIQPILFGIFSFVTTFLAGVTYENDARVSYSTIAITLFILFTLMCLEYKRSRENRIPEQIAKQF